MSATAFERRRRELAKQKEMQSQQKKTIEKVEKNSDFEELTKDELKAMLDEKGIEYNSKARKEELIKLLESE
ncbi:MAG: Rho-N domain-containing protein [Thermoanaerobacterium thermosaccharolyticum]|jgi:hypothetical protein